MSADKNRSVEAQPVFWAAVDLAKAGYPVFPVKGKEPTVEGGFYAATTDVSQVAAWIEDGHEHHDVAFATGLPSGVVAIDADSPETAAMMEDEYGPPTVRTRRGGHWYFRHPRNGKVTSNNLRDGLDRKGDGGYVVAPPCRKRTWTNGIPDKDSLPILPREFWSKKPQKTDTPRSLSQDRKDAAAEVIAARVATVPQGKRHEHLRHLCGVLLTREVPSGDAEDILTAAWTKAGGDLVERASREVPNMLATTEQALEERRATGVPKLEEITPGLYKELKDVFSWQVKIVSGGRELGPSRHERNGHASPIGILLSEVVPERVKWLWEGRIALGKLNLVDGDPGTGKSAATTDLAARVSVGKPWPDGAECEVGGVVILSAEDGLADTIRPRFDAAGGDPSKAVALSTVADAEGNERQLSIPDDLYVIEAAIERVGAVLVIIDPLMAFLPGEVNSHRDQDVRRALAPLARLAERTGAAIVVVRHLNKGSGGNALYRGGGSIGIVGAARSGLLIAKHPEDDGRRVLASIKSNLAAPAPSLLFSLSSTESGAVRVDWKGQTPLDASSLLSAPADHEERSALSEAQEFLREVLASGPVAAAEVRQEADSAGIAKRTLDRARPSLGVVSEREGETGKRGGGKWFWRLPSIKVANLTGWHSKSNTDRTDSENSPYISEEPGEGLRLPNAEDNKHAKDVGNLNRPLSSDVKAGESAMLTELKARRDLESSGLTVSEVIVAISRSKSGPALALGTYLEKPTVERLEWLTKAVLTARGMDTTDWKRHTGIVKEAAEDPGNHSLDCECEECV